MVRLLLTLKIERMSLIVSDQGYYDSRPLCPKGNHDCYDDKYGL
jgi:hypothetical protein